MTNESFGPALRDWRSRRRMSQLDLGLTANVSARHISFLEGGRSRPSRNMVLRLCDALDIPHGARNPLLAAAGFSPSYAARDPNRKELGPIRSAVDWMLERHAPFPAFAIDRHWTLVDLNIPAERLFTATGIARGDSLLTMADNPAIRATIANLPEVIAHSITRLRTESAHFGGDPILDDAIEKLSASLEGNTQYDSGVRPAFIPTIFRLGDTTFSFLTTIAQFGTAEDIAVAELKIELMFPADDSTRQAMFAMAAQETTA